MKKIILTLALAIGICSVASAQSGKNAMGFNLGLPNLGPGISYVRALNDVNALDFNLGLNLNNEHAGFGVAGFYDWNFNIAGGLGWYVGPGVFFEYQNREGDDHVGAGIGGNVGLSYKFSLPISVGMQYGLRFDFANTDAEWFYDVFSVSVRYHF